MGYTHYYRINHDAVESPEAFGRWALDVKRLLEHADANGIPLADAWGEKRGQWQINEGGVVFNGFADDSYETFSVSFKDTSDWFCKTARKPYDAVVVAALVRLKVYIGDALDFSSNGQNYNAETDQTEGWEEKQFAPAVALYDAVFDEPCDLSAAFGYVVA